MKFGTDGVRGRANVDLTAADALALGQAAGQVLGARTAVVGGDTRVSTPMLEAALVAGLTSAGVEVLSLGVAPTPMVAYHAAKNGSIGAVVSASHNPYHDNGIKLFGPGGTKLSDAVEQQIESVLADLLERGSAPGVEPGIVIEPGAQAAFEYLAHLAGALEGRRLDGLRVVIDAANGAASAVARAAVEQMGAEVIMIHDQPDGRNINQACGATDTGSVARAVLDARAHVGIALDGDADRLIAVDEHGQTVDGDHIIAICAADMHRRKALHEATVVVTVMSNLGLRLALDAAGIAVVETPVGDRSVLEALASGGFSLGGEQSGHIIFPRLASTGDGLLSALMLLDIVNRTGCPLSQLAQDSMTRMPQVLVNVTVARRLTDVAEQLADEISRAERGLDGAGRVLVRSSGTEPLVRVMVEAVSDEMASQTADRLAHVVRQRFGTA